MNVGATLQFFFPCSSLLNTYDTIAFLQDTRVNIGFRVLVRAHNPDASWPSIDPQLLPGWGGGGQGMGGSGGSRCSPASQNANGTGQRGVQARGWVMD